MSTRDSKFVRRLIISYSVLLIVILIMGIYLYSISIHNVSYEIRNQNKFTLEKTVHDMDTAFETMNVLASQIVANSNITQLANKSDINDNSFYYLAYHAKEELSVYVFTESILPIKEYYIFLNQSAYILSASQFSESNLFYKGTKNYFPEKQDSWLSMMNDYSMYRRFIPLDQYKSYNDSTYIYMLPLTEFSIKKVPSTICFEIDFESLEDIFSELNFYETGYLLVTESNGDTAFTMKGNQFTTDVPDSITTLEYEDGFSTFSEGTKDFYTTKVSSSFNKWDYYLVQPKDAALYSLIQYRNIFIASILIGLLIEIILIFFLSRTNINKIKQLGTELVDVQSRQKTLQKLVEVQKPIIKDSYLSNIFNGSISNQQELDYAEQYLKINTENRMFSVLYLVAYVNQYELHVDNSAVTGPDNLNYKEIIRSAITNFFHDSKGIIATNEKEFSILISSPIYDDTMTMTFSIEKTFYDLHKYLLENYSIWTFAGLGDWNLGLMITWKSYQQATQSVSYATKRSPFSCHSNIKREKNGFYYPIELTTQLTNFITSGNQSQVLEIFEILRHENMEERTLPINMMKYLLSDIRNTLYKIRFTLKIDEDNENDLNQIDHLFDQHMTLKLCEDLAIKLCQLFDNKSSGNKLISTIRDYIDENYQDPSLCLSKISDEFSISESYFSFLFKEEIGENFSSYLEKRRMGSAMELLLQTDMNISQLFSEVGYNNSHTFRRAFKKIYGVSPKDARTQSKAV